jgi:hypothetical protein
LVVLFGIDAGGVAGAALAECAGGAVAGAIPGDAAAAVSQVATPWCPLHAP